jgi:hypothetical protein
MFLFTDIEGSTVVLVPVSNVLGGLATLLGLPI